MPIDFKLFFRLLGKSFFAANGTTAPLRPKRLLFLLIFLIVWPVYQLITWSFLLLDDLLFPGYRSQIIEKPLFILGNFRSGSTFLHRLLSRDVRTFTSMRTVDIFLMPSVTQRKIFRFLSGLDTSLGSPINKGFRGIDNRSLGKVKIHKISMFDPEEDENILFHIWSTFFVVFMFPFLDEMPSFIQFDELVPVAEKQRIMAFYKQCVQRHLYANAPGLHFVSKSPASSAKIRSLLETFPDARIIYLARDPLEMLPSTVSWLSYAWNIFSDTGTKYMNQEKIMELALYWYQYPLKVIDEIQDNCQILNYAEMVANPEKVIKQVYEELGYEASPGLKKTIKRAVEETQTYISDHEYDLASMGLDEARIREKFATIYMRFPFEKK